MTHFITLVRKELTPNTPRHPQQSTCYIKDTPLILKLQVLPQKDILARAKMSVLVNTA